MSFVLLYPSIQSACSCSWLGWFSWRRQTKVCFYLRFSLVYFSLHPLKESSGSSRGFLLGFRVLLCADILFLFLFSHSWLLKKLLEYYKWCLESCFGISCFVSPIFLYTFFPAPSGCVSCTLWRTFYSSVLFLLYSRTASISCRTLIEPTSLPNLKFTYY